VEKQNLIKTCQVLEKIREIVKQPISIHCFIRPAKVNCPSSPHHGQNYNAFVGGSSQSAHLRGNAADWDCGEDCDQVRAELLPFLKKLNIRMENLQGSTWIHIDTFAPKPNRFFKP